MSAHEPHVAVVIPCYNVARWVADVIAAVPPCVGTIVAVDDASTDHTHAVLQALADPRVLVVRHNANCGVGAAMLSGWRTALQHGAEICVKMDGDGQMSADELPRLLEPLLQGEADYTKGNRFRHIRALRAMPRARIVGNSALSFFTKLVSGYWTILDPTNGYTAITADVLNLLDAEHIARRYFFETSMLIELNIIGAVVRDVDMPARYATETSSLRLSSALAQFPGLLFRGLVRRFVWRYVLQDFNAMTVCVLTAIPAMLFGVAFGAYHWWRSIVTGVPATAGTTFVAALPTILGFQCLLVAFVLDMLYQPAVPIGRRRDSRLRPPPSA